MMMNYDRQDPHSFCVHDTKTKLMYRIVVAVENETMTTIVGGDVVADDGGGVAGVVVDEIALTALRNYVYYNYCPRKCHQRQGVVLNCKMALCLAIIQ